MKLIVTTDIEAESLKVECQPTAPDENMYTIDLIGIFLDAITGVVETTLENVEATKIDKTRVEYHDLLTRLFTATIMKIFPEHMDFELSDAALIKAQDEILKEATETGKDLQEVIAQYNKDGEAYVSLLRGSATKKC